MKIKKQNKKGISLIVLVITIIVMIILAATVIISLTNNGIIGKANEAVDKTNEAEVKTLANLAWSEAYLNGARTQEELTIEVNKILKEKGITKADYIVDVTENGIEVTNENTWDHAYTCTNGVWSDKISSGNAANGEIVAKFYKTGNKITLGEEYAELLGELAVDEYRLVITGSGECGALLDENDGTFKAWAAEAATYDPEDENSSVPVLFGVTEVIVSGKIENVENLLLNTPIYLSLEALTIEDASIAITAQRDESGNLIENTKLKRVMLLGEGIQLGDFAFAGYSSLTSITIGNDVTSIGKWAFWGCSSLTSIAIPNSVTSIGDYAFGYCSGLTSITIPNSVTSIGGYAFYECSGLTNVTIPDSVTSIGDSAFYGCSSLTSIAIPSSVTSIGNHAFTGCSSLTSVTIPSSVISIGSDAFSRCSSLASVTIPSSVTSIGDSAFRDCSSLTSVNYTGTVEQWQTITFGEYWDTDTENYTIYCTNGRIAKDGVITLN